MKLLNRLVEDNFEMGVLHGTHTPNRHFQRSPVSIIQFLEDRGFEYVGGGSFSSVFAKPDDKLVVKVTNTPDDCWFNFALMCVNQNSPHLPTIVDAFEYIDPDGKPQYVAVMERLLEIDETDMPLQQKTELKNFIISIQRPDYPRLNKRAAEDFEKRYPNFAVVAKSITQKFPHCMSDMAVRNILIRPETGELVIADPIATIKAGAVNLD